MRLKWDARFASGARKGPKNPLQALATLRNERVIFLPITPTHAAATLTTPIAHKDPFDELLLAQAEVEGLHLLTRDGQLAAHPLARQIS